MRIPGVCNFDPATTVWCHANGISIGKGIGMKAHDLLGSYGCYNCHEAYDRRRPMDMMDRDEVEICFWEGHARSLLKLIERGIIKCL